MMCRNHDVPAGHAGDGRHRRRKEMVCPPCLAELARLRKTARNALACRAIGLYGSPCGRTAVTGYCASHS
jgi:hypothetical protein